MSRRCASPGRRRCPERFEPFGELDAEQLDRYARAAQVAFLLRAGRISCHHAERDGYKLWVTETVPRQACRQAPMAVECEDWREDEAAWEIGGVILSHLEQMGLVSARRCARVQALLTREVISRLPAGWRLTGLQVLYYIDREMSGPEVVSAAEARWEA